MHVVPETLGSVRWCEKKRWDSESRIRVAVCRGNFLRLEAANVGCRSGLVLLQRQMSIPICHRLSKVVSNVALLLMIAAKIVISCLRRLFSGRHCLRDYALTSVSYQQ